MLIEANFLGEVIDVKEQFASCSDNWLSAR